MVKDAEMHAEEDKQRRAKVEIRNRAEQLAHSTERTLAEAEGKADAELKTEIESAIADLRSALEDENAGEAELEPKINALMALSMKLGEAMYKAQEQAADAGPTPQADDGVVDAHFEEVDDSTKKD